MAEEDNPFYTLKIYEGDPKFADRYTVILYGAVYTMSENATSPQGINQYCCQAKDLDPRIKKEKLLSLEQVPAEVRKAIEERMRDGQCNLK